MSVILLCILPPLQLSCKVSACTESFVAPCSSDFTFHLAEMCLQLQIHLVPILVMVEWSSNKLSSRERTNSGKLPGQEKKQAHMQQHRRHQILQAHSGGDLDTRVGAVRGVEETGSRQPHYNPQHVLPLSFWIINVSFNESGWLTGWWIKKKKKKTS